MAYVKIILMPNIIIVIIYTVKTVKDRHYYFFFVDLCLRSKTELTL